MLLREAVPITPTTDAAALHDTLAAIGARLILDALEAAPVPVPQPEEGATYAPKLVREDGRIDWAQDAAVLDRRVRALNPWPGTSARLGDDVLKILTARPEAGAGVPGTTLDDGLLVACGAGALRLTRVQSPGRAALDTDAFLRGHPVPAGAKLG
jgi:methionyl-tRNA formyltransferase